MIATTRVRTDAALPSLADLRVPVVTMPRHTAVLMWRTIHPMGGKMRAENRLRLNAQAGRLSVDADRSVPTSRRLGFPQQDGASWADELTDRVDRGREE